MKKILFTFALAGLTALSAQSIINVDLGAGTAVTGTDTVGVVASEGWQQKSGFPDFSGLALNLDDGNPSGATISADFNGNVTTFGASTTDANYTMYNRGGALTMDSEGGTTVTVDSLGSAFTGGGYDVYVYFGSLTNFATDNPYWLSFSDGSTTYYSAVEEDVATYQGSFVRSTNTITPTEAPGAADGTNYVLFEGLTSSSFTITATNITNPDTGSSAAITGMQIVAVPEPSTYALLGGLVALLAAYFRRR